MIEMTDIVKQLVDSKVKTAAVSTELDSQKKKYLDLTKKVHN